MRGDQRLGRFKIEYETKSMDEGIVDDLRMPVGTTVSWWIWDEAYYAANPTDVLDDIYDVSNQGYGLGRKWQDPFDLPVIMARQTRGSSSPNERGYYVTDTLTLTVAVADVNRLLPAMMTNPEVHIKDRIVFQNSVFYPGRVLPQGRYADRYSVVSMDCYMVNAEELQNDTQFQQYAN